MNVRSQVTEGSPQETEQKRIDKEKIDNIYRNSEEKSSYVHGKHPNFI